MFQSSPAYKGGRFASIEYPDGMHSAFQSSPAYKGGRFAENTSRVGGWLIEFQSSPAYKGGRFARIRT